MIDPFTKLDRLLLTKAERAMLAELDEAIATAKRCLARERTKARLPRHAIPMLSNAELDRELRR